MFQKFTFFLLIWCVIWGSSTCRRSENLAAQEEEESAEQNVEVSLSFDIYNHTQGYLKSQTCAAASGSLFRLRIENFGVSGVDERRIVIRKGLLGERVAYSRTGECEFAVPDSDSSYSVYLMNAANFADYNAVDVRVGIYEGNLQFPREMNWAREDRNGLEGPYAPLAQAIHQLDTALDFSWARYGRFVEVDTEQNPHFTVGYGECREQYGWHTLNWAGVNPIHCFNNTLKMETFLEEIFELVTGTEDIAEKDTVSMITDRDTGRLNGIGRDLLAYIFIKDVK